MVLDSVGKRKQAEGVRCPKVSVLRGSTDSEPDKVKKYLSEQKDK